MAESFLTGSRVYGTPHDKSDIDLVCLVSKEDLVKLYTQADETSGSGPDPEDVRESGGQSVSLRFGRLNLICVTSGAWYESWRTGTDYLKAEAARSGPVTRGRAVEVFTHIRTVMGLIKRKEV